jgi:hypothetical protein
MRERNQPHFGLKSLYLVFGPASPAGMGRGLAAAGSAWRAGTAWPAGFWPVRCWRQAALLMEAMADVQLSRFLDGPRSKGRG